MNSEVRESSSPRLSSAELSSVLRDYMNATQRLQQTHETLQREVVRLRSEIASKDRELERRRRLASLGELAAGVAHEVRNPLGAIQLYSGLLRRQLTDPGRALELIEKIDAGIHAIDCIVRDTLALAPPGGKIERQPLRSIIARAYDVCRLTLETRRVTLEADYDEPEVEVVGEPAALQRVFVNLIDNAAQASPANAIVIVRVSCERNGQVEARVLDQGPGLADEISEKLFDPFFTTKKDGIGLGLTIAHRLVEAHGGNLRARNRPEGGAEFVVVLPTTGNFNERPSPREGAGQTSAA